MDIKSHHMMEHANRGFGEDPANCPVCPHEHKELAKRVEVLETKTSTIRTPWAQIAVMVTGSVFAAFIVERFVRRR